MYKLIYNEGVNLYDFLYKETYGEDTPNNKNQSKYVFCISIMSNMLETLLKDIDDCCYELKSTISNIKIIILKEEAFMADKNIIIITIDKELDNKVTNLCKENDIPKESFVFEALENQLSISQSPRLEEKINQLCEENDMSKDFFITKALEDFCNKLKENK